MTRRRVSISMAAGAVLLALTLEWSPVAAQSQASALRGEVSSATEGLEGVLVSAKRDGSNVTVTVVSNADGCRWSVQLPT